MSSASKTWTLRARQAVLVLVLLAGPSSLESSPPAQANSLTVLFSPGAGTFVGSDDDGMTAGKRLFAQGHSRWHRWCVPSMESRMVVR